jgi:hypothetical protein
VAKQTHNGRQHIFGTSCDSSTVFDFLSAPIYLPNARLPITQGMGHMATRIEETVSEQSKFSAEGASQLVDRSGFRSVVVRSANPMVVRFSGKSHRRIPLDASEKLKIIIFVILQNW